MDCKESIKEIIDILRDYGNNLIKLSELLQEIVDTSKE